MTVMSLRASGPLSQLSWQQFSWSVSSPRLSQNTASEGSGATAELLTLLL